MSTFGLQRQRLERLEVARSCRASRSTGGLLAKAFGTIANG
jgi:hypothetical protein